MKALALVLLGSLATGCTTHIITNNPDARIYVDDEFVGNGRADIGRIGPPRDAVVRIESGGAVVEHTLEREFGGVTVLLGLISYFTGFYWGWTFPDALHLSVPNGPGGNPWQQKPVEEPVNPWLNPEKI